MKMCRPNHNQAGLMIKMVARLILAEEWDEDRR